MTAVSPELLAQLEQRTAERIIKGTHKPSLAHWRINKAGPRPESSWQVLAPLQLPWTLSAAPFTPRRR